MFGKIQIALLACLSIGWSCVALHAQSETQNAQSETQKTFSDLTSSEYQNVFNEFVPKGFCPIEIAVRVEQDIDKYDIVIQKKPENLTFSARHLMTDNKFHETNTTLESRGFKLDIHKTYQLKGIQRHVAVWILENNSKPLGTIWEDEKSVPISGDGNKATQPLDQLMQSLLAENQVVGATLAVTFQGKLIYSRGFGYSDLEQQQVMEPETRMRIASVSKPITGAAILQLIDQGKLSFDDRVFAILPFQPVSNSTEVDQRLAEITIQHLLRHEGGWDRGVSFDPMFRQAVVAKHVGKSVPVGPPEIIRYMLSRRLDFDPGTKTAYSNFGYSLLGRVIEEVTGEDYETYVKKNVLAPLNIKSMEIGRTKLSERAGDEPIYYTQDGKLVPSILEADRQVPQPYGLWYLESFDSHGGWIASAQDLTKFLAAFDNPHDCPLMSAEAVSAMFVPPSVGSIEPGKESKRHYGCGWSIVVLPDGKRINAYHGGLFSGASTMIARRHDGFDWAVLFNTDRTADNKIPASVFDTKIHAAINAVKSNLMK